MIMTYKTFRCFRTFVYWFNAACVALIIGFITEFVCHFHGRFSDKLSDWASFGSFLSGSVGVVVVTMNLLDIFYIYIKIGRASHQQYLTTLRSPSYKLIIDELYKVRQDNIGQAAFKIGLKAWLEDTDFDSLLFLRPDQITLFDRLRGELVAALDAATPNDSSSIQNFRNKKREMINALKDVMKETNK